MSEVLIAAAAVILPCLPTIGSVRGVVVRRLTIVKIHATTEAIVSAMAVFGGSKEGSGSVSPS